MTIVNDSRTYVEEILQSVGISPRGVQVEAMDAGVFEGNSVLVCSPTGSGKTLVGEMALLTAVTSGKKGLYLVPLRALASQVSQILKQRYESRNIRIGISTGDFQSDGSILGDYDIIVTTYERTDSLLRHKTEWLNEIGTVVIDEIQNLSDERRGARLESVIIRLRHLIEGLQIVALSATIGAPDVLAEWLGCELVHWTDRPVPLRNIIVTTKNRDESIEKYVMATVQRNGQAIVFHRTRKESEASAKRLAKNVCKQLTTEEQQKVDLELKSIEHYHVSMPSNLRSLLHEGIAFHHAGLTYSARNLVESLFRRGLVRTVCATTTLASGMDLPTRTVILANSRSPSDYTQLLAANRVHQMLGRAGRPGKDKKGFGVILADSRGQADEIEKKYFHTFRDDSEKVVLEPKFDSVKSRMNVGTSLTEQLLVFVDLLGEASLKDVEDVFLAASLHFHLGIRDTRAPMRLLNLDAITVETALECHAINDTMRAVRSGVLGNVQLRETTDRVIGGIVTERGGQRTVCRFSARSRKSGVKDGPMCSCGRPINEDGILCTHLVALGAVAAKEQPQLANYVIPIALGETSPFKTLVRMGLLEGTTEDRVRSTRLGMLVNRLYLSIDTVREMLAVLPFVEDTESLLSLIKHLTMIESQRSMEECFEHIIGLAITTDLDFEELAVQTGVSVGDLYGLLDTVRWLGYSIMIIAEQANLIEVADMARHLHNGIDSRFKEMDGESDGNY